MRDTTKLSARLRTERISEGISEADQDMIHALAGRVVIDRLERGVVVGHTDSGRAIVELRGEPTEAEVMFEGLKRHG